MRVIGYVRVSTELQAVEGMSLEAQKTRIIAWCESNGGTLAAADLFVDAGISGKRADNRPGLQSAIAAVARVPGSVLVVYSLSRLARSTRDTLAIAERLDSAKADLVSLSEKIDTTSAAGKMVFRLLAVLAEFERDLISERTRSVVALKRSKGERIGQLPFGHVVGDDGRTVSPCPREQAVIGRMQDWKASGWSDNRIATELTATSTPTKNGKTSWSHKSVASILSHA